MPSLTQLLTSHDRLLVLDAASKNVQVGLLRTGFPDKWRRGEHEAGTGIFVGTESLLTGAGLQISDVGAFVFCEGPGSMLGTRTIAMALRIWQVLSPRPVYAYQSLAVAGRYEWSQKDGRDFAVIADARRDAWHFQPVQADGRMMPLERLPSAAMPAVELVTPEDFRAWAPPPHPAAVCCYDLAKLFPASAGGDLFRAVGLPDAFQHDAPAYRKWAPQIHRAVIAEGK